MLSFAKNIACRWRNMGCWWNGTDRGNQIRLNEAYPNATLVTTNPRCSGMWLNTGLCGGRQATYCLNHATLLIELWGSEVSSEFLSKNSRTRERRVKHEAALHYVFHSAVRRAYRCVFPLVAWRRYTSRVLIVGTDATKLRPGVFSQHRELRAKNTQCLVKLSHVCCGTNFIVF